MNEDKQFVTVERLREAEARAERAEKAITYVDRAGQRDAKLALSLYTENQRLRGILNADMLSVTLRGGIEVWGIEFVQGLEQQLDTLPWFERTGKTVTDEYVSIQMRTKLADGTPAHDAGKDGAK